MKRWQTLLWAGLVLQLALVAALGWLPSRPQAGAAQPLLTLDRQQLDRIELSDDEGNRVRLERRGDGWRLPDYHDLPVRAGAVDGLLDRLAQIRLTWPVADSDSARSRFAVASQHFRRKLSLQAGERTLAAFYLGSAPSYRHSHLRRDGEAAIYAVALSSHDLPARPERWFDTTLLRPQGLVQIEGEGFSLHYQQGHWLTAAGKEASRTQAEALAAALRQLTVEAAAPAASGVTAEAWLQWSDGRGSRRWQLYRDGDQHWLQPEGDPLRYRISALRYRELTEIDTRALLAGADADDAATGATDASTADVPAAGDPAAAS